MVIYRPTHSCEANANLTNCQQDSADTLEGRDPDERPDGGTPQVR